MAINRNIFIIVLSSLFLSICPFCLHTAWAKDFIVVIDAGHGGKDPGAVGAISKEKDINLKVALKVGNLIEKNCDNVKVIYTRKKDVFIALDKRAEIANNAKADLFISIHTNSIAKSKTIKGASTWTLGLARSQANLEVAKRENSVILYESDYQTRYAGFDPKSSESYIIFEFMQDKYMEQSVHLATLMQSQFKTTCKRVDNGVHQAEFLVLRATAMPSILIELGFISTPEEERFLNTDNGINTMSNGIYQGFVKYKKEHDDRISETTLGKQTARQTKNEDVKPTPTKIDTANNELSFAVQILTSSTQLKDNDKKLKGLKNVSYYKEGNLFKYIYGSSADYNKVVKARREISDKFSDAFIIAFKNGAKINVNDAIKEFKNGQKK